MRLNNIIKLMEDITEHDYCNVKLGDVELKVPPRCFDELLFENTRGTIVNIDSFIFNTGRGPVIIKKGDSK